MDFIWKGSLGSITQWAEWHDRNLLALKEVHGLWWMWASGKASWETLVELWLEWWMRLAGKKKHKVGNQDGPEHVTTGHAMMRE